MVNASSFATGSFPGTIGFYGNRFWAPGASGFDAKGAPSDFNAPIYTEDYAVLRALDDHWHHDLLQAPTLLERARKAGLKTAVVGKSGPAFLQDIHEGGTILDENVALPLDFAKRLAKAGLPLPANTVRAYDADRFQLEPDNGTPTAQLPLVTLKDGVTSDASDGAGAPPTASNAYLMNAFLSYILPVEKPDVSFVWLRNPDSTEHLYGVGSPNFHLALRAQDELLGKLQARLKELGMEADTDLVIVSDHAHSNVAGPRDLFPLRGIEDGRVGRPDAESGYSASGAIRLAETSTRGLHGLRRLRLPLRARDVRYPCRWHEGLPDPLRRRRQALRQARAVTPRLQGARRTAAERLRDRAERRQRIPLPSVARSRAGAEGRALPAGP